MRRNKTFLWRNSKYVFTKLKIPLESSWDISNITYNKFLCQFRVNCNWSKVNLILNVFQINSVTTSSDHTQFSNFLISNYFVAHWCIKLMLTFCRSKSNFNLFSLSWINSDLLLRNICNKIFFKLFFLSNSFRNIEIKRNSDFSFTIIHKSNYFCNISTNCFDSKVNKFIFGFQKL